MDLSHITSQSLRRVLSLTERKDELVKLIGEIETEIAKVLSGGTAPVAKARPATKSSPVRKARGKARSGGLKDKIISALVAAGPQGLRVKEIAGKVGSPAGNISVWLSTTGKNLTTKLEPGLYTVKGTKPDAPVPAASVVKPTAAVEAVTKPRKKAAKRSRLAFKLSPAGIKI